MPLPVADGQMPALVANEDLPEATRDKKKYSRSGLTDATALQLHAALTRIMEENNCIQRVNSPCLI